MIFIFNQVAVCIKCPEVHSQVFDIKFFLEFRLLLFHIQRHDAFIVFRISQLISVSVCDNNNIALVSWYQVIL